MAVPQGNLMTLPQPLPTDLCGSNVGMGMMWELVLLSPKAAAAAGCTIESAGGPHLFRGDVDVWYLIVLADDGDMCQDVNGRDVSSKYADPGTDWGATYD